MDFLEIAKKRQSCRNYDEAREVEQEKLEAVAAGLGVQAIIQRQDVFDAMYTI